MGRGGGAHHIQVSDVLFVVVNRVEALVHGFRAEHLPFLFSVIAVAFEGVFRRVFVSHLGSGVAMVCDANMRLILVEWISRACALMMVHTRYVYMLI